MANYSMRTNPYISATQGFVDAYQRGLGLAMQKRQLDIQERRAAIYDKYMMSQMSLAQRRADKPDIRSGAIPWIQIDGDEVETIYTPPTGLRKPTQKLTPSGMGVAEKIAKEFKEGTPYTDPEGWFTLNVYTHKDILKQYELYRSRMGYENLSKYDQSRLDDTWDTMWANVSRPQWNPKSSDVQTLRSRGKTLFPQKRPGKTLISEPSMLSEQDLQGMLTPEMSRGRNRMLFPSVPDARLSPYWGDLSDVEKQEIIQAIKNNPRNITEILRRLGG